MLMWTADIQGCAKVREHAFIFNQMASRCSLVFIWMQTIIMETCNVVDSSFIKTARQHLFMQSSYGCICVFGQRKVCLFGQYWANNEPPGLTDFLPSLNSPSRCWVSVSTGRGTLPTPGKHWVMSGSEKLSVTDTGTMLYRKGLK